MKLFLKLLPIFIGLLLSGIFTLLYDYLPIVNISIDIGSLAIIFGLIATIIIFWYEHQKNSNKQRHQKDIQLIMEDNNQFMLRLDHELKNPLSAIQTGIAYSAQLISEEPQYSEPGFQHELPEVLNQIKNQAQRIGRLISDLRKIGELESCQIEETDVNINHLLSQLVEEANHFPDTEKRNIQLSTPIAPWRLPIISIDEDLLYISLSNLLNNAIKYSDQEDIIEVRAYENRNYVIVEVADRGMGIPADEMESVWKKLYRARNAKIADGNGLGLTMVQTIILRLGGEIDLRSTEGVGTVVSIQLPKVSAN